MKPGDIVYETCYNSCIHESAIATLSIHITKKGANIAMKKHKEERRKEWMDLYGKIKDRKSFRFGKYEHWCVIKTILQE